MGDRVVIMVRRRGVPGSLAAWAAATALGLLLLGAAPAFTGGQPWLIAALVALGALVILAGLSMCLAAWQIMQLSGPVLEFTEAGFRDYRLSRAVIPWDRLSWWIGPSLMGPVLRIDLDRRLATRLGLPRWMSVMSTVNRALALPPHSVMTLGTGLSVEEIGDLMARYKAPTWPGRPERP